MTTISFWARGDSNTANNASINSVGTSQVPVTELTFVATPGSGVGADPDGDIILDYVSGAVDPDTQVIINGVQMDFQVEFSGNLPDTKKFADLGVDSKEVVVVSAGGQRYYFLSDGSGTYSLMNDLPNGSVPITGLLHKNVMVCFANGTLIATPTGEHRVETLKVGDLVVTADGQIKPIRWIGARTAGVSEMLLKKELRPVVIPAGAFGANLPHSDLRLSRQHRLAVEGWQVEMLFGTERVLVRAGHLDGAGIHTVLPHEPVTYYHILLDEHDMLIANGLASESFQPGPVGLCALDDAARAELEALDPALVALSAIAAAPSLKAHETALLMAHILPRTAAAPASSALRLAA